MAVFAGCADEPATPQPSPQRISAALTATGTSVLGFEEPAAWTVPSNISKARSATHTEGTYSLAINARGWVPIRSQAINFAAPIGPNVTYDLMLPTQQANPSWYGATQAYLECPTANVFNAFLGQIELTGRPLGQWQQMSIPVPAGIVAQLTGGCPDLTVTIALTVPANATGTYNLDKLVLGASPPVVPTFDRRAEIVTIDETMGFERADRWSATGATVTVDNRHTDGLRSLALSNLGLAEVRSVPLATLAGITSTIGFEIMLPTQQLNPSPFGYTELYVDVPSLGISNRLIGRQDLTGKAKNQWLMVRFAVDASLQRSLRQRYTDLRFKVVLNVPPGSPGPYLLDNLRTNAVSPFLECVLTQGGKTKALFGYDNPSSDLVEIADPFVNKLSGAGTDMLPVQAVTFFQSGRHHGALWVDTAGGQITWTIGRNVAAASTGSSQCPLTPGTNNTAVTVGTFSVPVPGVSPSGIVPSERIGTTSTTPGALQGTFSVDNNGGAGYRVPLRVSPGRAGIEPDLSLVYGGEENGALGVGWTLSGFSEISRCARTIALDGFAEEVSFDDVADAAFCLDGERLIPVSGASGTINGREFRTERNNFAKIVARKNSTENGPDTFEVSLRDGRILTFGGGTATLGGSRVQYTASATSRTPAVPNFQQQVRLAWSLAEVRDRHGNSMRFNYFNNENSVDRAHQHLPDRIDYTFFSDGTPALRSVRFVYLPRPDAELSYISGFPIRIAQRLSRIEIWGPNPTTSALLRLYSLGYNRWINPLTRVEEDLNNVTRRSLLTSVRNATRRAHVWRLRVSAGRWDRHRCSTTTSWEISHPRLLRARRTWTVTEKMT